MGFCHICRWDKCAVYIFHSKISTDPGLLKIWHSRQFVAACGYTDFNSIYCMGYSAVFARNFPEIAPQKLT